MSRTWVVEQTGSGATIHHDGYADCVQMKNLEIAIGFCDWRHQAASISFVSSLQTPAATLTVGMLLKIPFCGSAAGSAIQHLQPGIVHDEIVFGDDMALSTTA